LIVRSILFNKKNQGKSERGRAAPATDYRFLDAVSRHLWQVEERGKRKGVGEGKGEVKRYQTELNRLIAF
jgi:hypothetical protein